MDKSTTSFLEERLTVSTVCVAYVQVEIWVLESGSTSQAIATNVSTLPYY